MTTEDQRAQPRYRCRCYAKVLSTQSIWEAHLLNLSESGALVGIVDPHEISSDEDIELLVEIAENDMMNLEGKVAHVNEHYVGIDCKPRTQNDYALLKHRLDELQVEQQQKEKEEQAKTENTEENSSQ